MRNLFPANLAIAFITLSCSSEKDSKKDITADINEMCKCYRDAKESSEKFMECTTRNEKMRDKYKKDNAQLIKYDDELTTCIAGN